MASLVVCACGVAITAALLTRRRWRKGKDAALRRYTQGGTNVLRAGQGNGQYVLNQAYAGAPARPTTRGAFACGFDGVVGVCLHGYTCLRRQ